jgi:hypothetical protein
MCVPRVDVSSIRRRLQHTLLKQVDGNGGYDATAKLEQNPIRGREVARSSYLLRPQLPFSRNSRVLTYTPQKGLSNFTSLQENGLNQEEYLKESSWL